MAKVKNTGTHVVDLSDGRVLAPGDVVDDVTLGNAHNKSLVDSGFLTEVNEEKAPPAPKPDPNSKEDGK